MKKYFFLAVAAAVALAACTKNDIDETSNEARQINFSAVANKATKAAIDGVYFPNDAGSFGVYSAYLASGDWDAAYASSSLYMGTSAGAGQEVRYVSGDKIWEPTTTYYWPLQGKLTFFAYYPFTGLTSPAYTQGTQSFSIGSFTVNETPASQVDVLVSSFAKDKTGNESAYDDGTTTSDLTGVPIVFKHMLSKVVFTAAAASDVFDSGLSFKITDITVGARGTSAGMTVTPGSTPTWTDPTALTAYTVFSGSFPNETVTPVAAANWLATSQSAQIGSALLMIPNSDFLGADDSDNNKAAENNDDEYVSVSYTLYRMSDGLAMGSKTFKFWLNDNQGSVDNWDAGKKYTYQLTIGLEKIYFSPSVTDWTDGGSQEANVQ